MNAAVRQVVSAVAAGKVTRKVIALAQRIVEQDAHTEKAPIRSVAHHAKVRRAEERQEEAVAIEVWFSVRDRTRLDHRGKTCCEACHKFNALEPHHLILGERVDAVELVMALCAGCHRLDPKSAHRAPRHFAQTIVIPWASAHGYPTPNRREYR